MVKRFLVIAAFSVAAMLQSGAALTQQPSEEAIAQARDKIDRFMASYDADVGLGPRPKSSQRAELVDLNQDGVFEAYVYLDGITDCGALGCARIVLDLSGPDARAIGRFIGFEITSINTTTGGWRDLRLDGLRLVKSRVGYVPAWRLTDSSFDVYGQRLLSEAGYDVGPFDGQIGKRTRSAIRQFEIDNGLSVNGEMSRALIAALETHRLAAAHQRNVDFPTFQLQKSEVSSISGIATEAASGLVTDAWALAGGAFREEIPYHDCNVSGNASEIIKPAEVQRGILGSTGVILSDEADFVVVDGSQDVGYVDGKLGDDLIQIREAPTQVDVIGGGGADLLVLCSVADANRAVLINTGDGGFGADIDSDVVVLYDDVFRNAPAGHIRDVGIYGFAPTNDRLFVEVAANSEVSIADNFKNALTLTVGQARITIHNAELLTASEFNLGSVILVPSGTLARASQSELPTAAKAEPEIQQAADGCGLAGLSAYDPTIVAERWGADQHFLTHASDAVLVGRQGRTTAIHAGRGDDRIAFQQLADDLRLDAGSGADRIDLCSMSGLTTSLRVGTDRDIDTVVIHREVFAGIPEGMTRTIFVEELEPTQDRVVVDVPPQFAGWQGESRQNVANIGPVRLYLLGPSTITPKYLIDMIEVAAPGSIQ